MATDALRPALADLLQVMTEAMGTGGWVPTALHTSFMAAMLQARQALDATPSGSADGEAVAEVDHGHQSGRINWHADPSKLPDGTPLYTRPTPDAGEMPRSVIFELAGKHRIDGITDSIEAFVRDVLAYERGVVSGNETPYVHLQTVGPCTLRKAGREVGSADAKDAGREIDLLRAAYEDARRILRYDGISKSRVVEAVESMRENIERVKQFDGGYDDAATSQTAEGEEPNAQA